MGGAMGRRLQGEAGGIQHRALTGLNTRQRTHQSAEGIAPHLEIRELVEAGAGGGEQDHRMGKAGCLGDW